MCSINKKIFTITIKMHGSRVIKRYRAALMEWKSPEIRSSSKSMEKYKSLALFLIAFEEKRGRK